MNALTYIYIYFTSPFHKLFIVAKQKDKMLLGGIRKVESHSNYQAFDTCFYPFKIKVIFTIST